MAAALALATLALAAAGPTPAAAETVGQVFRKVKGAVVTTMQATVEGKKLVVGGDIILQVEGIPIGSRIG